MAKFTSDDKLSAAQRYLDGTESYESIAAILGTTESVVRNWVKQYEHNGVEAFRKSYTSYSAQFKLDVLNYMNHFGTSPNETAAIFQITSPALIRKWMNRRPTIKEKGASNREKGNQKGNTC